MPNSPTILRIVSIPFDENTYLAYFEGRSDCLVFDPGMQPDKIVAEIEQRQLTPAAILCTHGHSDHIAGNEALKQRWPECLLIIGAGDEAKLTDPVGNLSAGFGVNLLSPPADQVVSEGEVLELAGFRLEVRETPGHSSGHVVFLASGLSPLQVFGGDVLFAGSVGRTDFPDCSFEVLKRSIHEKLFPLPDDSIVLPGHGPATTIGAEKQANPFVGLA
jgi:hydroxyacylglutathione hydrolase